MTGVAGNEKSGSIESAVEKILTALFSIRFFVPSSMPPDQPFERFMRFQFQHRESQRFVFLTKTRRKNPEKVPLFWMSFAADDITDGLQLISRVQPRDLG